MTHPLAKARGWRNLALPHELAAERERCAKIAEATGPQSNERYSRASADDHMWRNTHWQEAQEAIAAAIRKGGA